MNPHEVTRAPHAVAPDNCTSASEWEVGKLFMKGTPEEEVGRGKLDKYETLRTIHQSIAPAVYLEIGVQKGFSLDLAQCTAIGVDPFPRTVAKSNQTIHAITSDSFFSRDIKFKPDLVFIDGLHLFEQTLMDFINCERICHTGSVIVMDDIFPAHPSQALRKRRTHKWAGDVWKVYEILKEYRPDLVLQPLDVNPTGLLMISDLDPENTCLFENYCDITHKYTKLSVPESILQREDLS